MKITDKLRAQAAHLLSVCASTREWGLRIEQRSLGYARKVADLAILAHDFALSRRAPLGEPCKRSWNRYFNMCAEAESMLRTGWTP